MKKLLSAVAVLMGFLALVNSANACIFMPEAVLLNDTACGLEIRFTVPFEPVAGRGVFASLSVSADLSALSNKQITELINDVPEKWDLRDGYGLLCASGFSCSGNNNCHPTPCDLYGCVAPESENCLQEEVGVFCRSSKPFECEQNLPHLEQVTFSTGRPLYTSEDVAKSDIESFLSKYGLSAKEYSAHYTVDISEELQTYKNYPYQCNNNFKTLSLTDNDISIIADFMSNGYSVIRQTESEYSTFLEHANNVNKDLTTCDYYDAVAYKNGWTGYVLNSHSDKTVFCANQPVPLFKCGSGSVNAIWNDLQTSQQAQGTPPSEIIFQTGSEQPSYIIPAIFIGLLVVALMIFAAKRKKR